MENEILKSEEWEKEGGDINIFHKMEGELPRKTLSNLVWCSHNSRTEIKFNCIIKKM